MPAGFSCENLDLTQLAMPEEVVAEWVASESHRNCLLHTRPKYVGIGVVQIPNVGYENNSGDTYIVVSIQTENL